jgi:hypothetical protein
MLRAAEDAERRDPQAAFPLAGRSGALPRERAWAMLRAAEDAERRDPQAAFSLG